jgi:Plasmid pRiA4b ORF-3-like protein
MADETALEVYQLHVWIRQISPMVWRRLLVRSDSTLADLHHTLQIVFGWTDAQEWDLEAQEESSERAKKLLKAVSEFHHYIEVDQSSIPNYRDLYRYGEAIAT